MTEYSGGLEKLDAIVEPMLHLARSPGAGLAIVVDDRTVFAKGYGYRDLDARRPATATTVYPIASTTKSINTTLLGMLVDEGRLAWDIPVQDYLPSFRLRDPFISTQVTLRDLVTMRTGLPRHDWMWFGNPIERADLVRRLRHLDVSAGFRERFQYNNMTATAAGHVAEVVTGRRWEELVQEKIFQPLCMHSSGFALPATGDMTLSYHENSGRNLRLTQRLATEVTAPSGGAIHSTVEDMARWIAFNLSGGKAQGRALIQSHTLAEIHTPQIMVGADASAPTAGARYALGWFVDTYNGCLRISHGGYVHDVSSEVTLFPQQRIGIVSFTNFGAPSFARLINQQAFDLIAGLQPAQTPEERLAQYETKVEETRTRNACVRRVGNTSPSHSLDDYTGRYQHAGYGTLEIRRSGPELIFQRNELVLLLQHWHYDAWIAQDCELFAIHGPHPFDRASRFLFETNAEGEIAAMSIQLEPAVAAIRFQKQ